MSGPDRKPFVERVRCALGRGAADAVPAPPAVDDAVARLAGEGDDLVAMFEARATEVGMAVQRCAADDLATALVERLEALGVQRIVAGLARVDADGSLVEAIQAAGIAVDDWRGDRTMAAGYDAGAGVTDVRAAIAETGTLVYASDADHGRGLMLVPPIHLAVVRTRDIIPDMLDYMRQMGAASPAELPASQTLITGPSKTADIEGVLVTGVHGPGAVHVLLVA